VITLTSSQPAAAALQSARSGVSGRPRERSGECGEPRPWRDQNAETDGSRECERRESEPGPLAERDTVSLSCCGFAPSTNFQRRKKLAVERATGGTAP
jgi:hypothetical protein